MFFLTTLKNNLWQSLTVFGVTVFFILSLFSGISSGKNQAAAETILINTQALQNGLQLFYKDQDRYPTELEFTSQQIMGNYFSSFPPQIIAMGSCTENFLYKRASFQNYQLNFCLPTGVSPYSSGWNSYVH